MKIFTTFLKILAVFLLIVFIGLAAFSVSPIFTIRMRISTPRSVGKGPACTPIPK